MSQPDGSVNEAAHEFLKALCDYQTATRDMNRSLQHLYGQLYDFSQPLKHLVVTTGTAITAAARPDLQTKRR